MSTNSFETDDIFDRKRYAQFMYNIIKISDSIKRAEENRSYTICLDSGYGTGKSVFLNKLRTMIEDDFLNNGIGIISYNAWENDFFDDAFAPFLYSLLNDKWMEDARKANKYEVIAETAKATFIEAAKGLSKAIVKNKLGDEALEILSSMIGGLFKKHDSPRNDANSDYSNLRSSIKNFNESLESCIIAWDLNKLVIIIDELDRCRPDFAIRTLEITKHLMNVKNVVFLFAVDKSQLSKAVEKVYGYGMDSDGYLCKFFDYIAVMPKPSIKDYVLKFGNLLKGDTKLESYIIDLSDVFMLSLRDIDTIMISYYILIQSFLHKYKDYEAHYLYLVCLVIKYKYPSLFHKLANEQYSEQDLGVFRTGRAGQNSTYIRLLENAGKKIADRDTNYKLYTYENKEIANMRGISFSDTIINYYTKVDGHWLARYIECSENITSIDGLFFIEDRSEWDNCKGMSYGMYIHKKLEMFNFEQPEDNQQFIDDQKVIILR